MSKYKPVCKLCRGSKVILTYTPGKNPSVYGRYEPCQCVQRYGILGKCERKTSRRAFPGGSYTGTKVLRALN